MVPVFYTCYVRTGSNHVIRHRYVPGAILTLCNRDVDLLPPEDLAGDIDWGPGVTVEVCSACMDAEAEASTSERD